MGGRKAAPRWRVEELVLLREHYSVLSIDELAARLGRTPIAVAARAGMLRLKKRRHKPVPDILQDWELDLESEGKSQGTRIAYVNDLVIFSRHAGEDLERVGPEDLRAYVRAMTQGGAHPATRGRRIAALRNFYEWLRRRRGLQVSVARDIRPPRRPRRTHRWLTGPQVAALRAVLSGDGVAGRRDRAMVELGLMGLRVSEVAGLELGRVLALDDPDEASIIVRCKGDKEQVVPLTRDAHEALASWLAVRPAVPTSAVFVRLPYHPDGPTQLHYVSVEKIFKGYVDRAHIPLPPRSSFHLLRHTAGQRMADLGFGIEEAQVFLGHESPNTTMIYCTVSSTRLKNAARRFAY